TPSGIPVRECAHARGARVLRRVDGWAFVLGPACLQRRPTPTWRAAGQYRSVCVDRVIPRSDWRKLGVRVSPDGDLHVAYALSLSTRLVRVKAYRGTGGGRRRPARRKGGRGHALAGSARRVVAQGVRELVERGDVVVVPRLPVLALCRRGG